MFLSPPRRYPWFALILLSLAMAHQGRAEAVARRAENASTIDRTGQTATIYIQRSPISANRAGWQTTVPTFTNPPAVAGDVACTCDLDCGDGNPCTTDVCNAGVCEQTNTDPGIACRPDGDAFCDLLGQCDGDGLCLDNELGGSICADGQTCDPGEEDCDGCATGAPNCTDCTVDGECAAGPADPALCQSNACGPDGRCIVEFDCAAGEACDGAGSCTIVNDGRCCADIDNCALTTLAACAGPWSALGGADCACPKASYGIGDNEGVVFNFQLAATEPPCTLFNRIGDDYALDNLSYLNLEQFRFVGGVDGTGDGTMVFEFYDGSVSPPVLVFAAAIGFDPVADAGIFQWTITLGVPTVIPPEGFVVMRPGVGSGETVNWLSTNDVASIGANDPDEMWINGGPTTFLQPDAPDILAYELIGTKIAAPTGACCTGGAGECDDVNANLAWLCDDAGGTFVAGATCLDAPCDVATCCLADGSCIVDSPTNCTAAGGTVGVIGGTCEPNCCDQPIDESGNGCHEAVTIALDVSTNAADYTWTGDNTDATNGVCSGTGDPCRTFQADGEDCPAGEICLLDGDCGSFGNDPLEWISFSINNAATVDIDYCCTDGLDGAGGGPSVFYVVVTDDCDATGADCGNTIFRDAACATGCPDGNPCSTFTLPAGTYYYPVYSDRHCTGTTTDCSTDADCGGAPGSCVQTAGEWNIHVTANPLPNGACCLEDVCVEVDILECESMGGFSLLNTPVCLPGPSNACLRGSCCQGAGVCDDNGGAGIDITSCTNAGGLYIGGARCVEDDPCPVCELSDDANCQFDTGQFIVVNDRALWQPGAINRWVDDFTATSGGPLDRVCWYPAFFNPTLEAECSAEGETPPDDFEIRLYDDNSGLPGAEIGSAQPITPDARISLGATSRVWLYSAPVDIPPTLAPGNCYWLEITGAGEGEGGCTVYATLSDDGNHYSINDSNEVFGPEDIVTSIGTPPDSAVDLAFCVGNGMAPGGCGEFTGACCLCGGGCSDDVTVTDCISTQGFFFPGEACIDVACPPGAPGDDCGNNVVLEHDGGDPANDIIVDFDIRCATTDGPNTPVNTCAASGFEAIVNDVWYEYTAPCCGVVTASMCPNDGGDTDYDSILVAYGDGTGTCNCPTGSATQLACGDSSCGITLGPSRVDFPVEQDDCFLLRVAGSPETGTGTMVVSVACQPCPTPIEAPFADDRVNVNLESATCATDGDCTATSVCRDGNCYVPSNRFLAIRPNPLNMGDWTYRVSLDTGVAGTVVLGFAGTPVTRLAAGPGPGTYAYSPVVDVIGADYRDWVAHADAAGAGYIMLTGCPVAPDNSYVVQAIQEGDDTSDEGNYSAPLSLPTARFGDATGGGAVNSPPDGSSNLIDVFASVLAFQNNQGGLKHWYDMDSGGTPNGSWTLADTFEFVQAFQNNPYSGPAPTACP